MFELLEDLEGKFKQQFKKQVSMTEITRYSLRLNKSSWVVITNSNVYLMLKKLFFISTWKQSLSDLKEASSDGHSFSIKTAYEEKQIKVSQDKKSEAQKLATELNKLIS